MRLRECIAPVSRRKRFYVRRKAMYNLIEIELWKIRVAEAERKAILAYRTKDLKSPEALMLERLLRGVRLLFSTRLRPSSRPLRYAMQQE